MTKEIPVHQQIQPQEYVDEKYHLSTGEVIHDPHQRGMVGWLDQTESEPGSVKTAKMELVGGKYALYVYPDYRKPYLKIGSELFERLLQRLKTKNYQVLNINMVTPELYDFYLNNIRAATQLGLVSSYILTPVSYEDVFSHHKVQIYL